MNARSPRNPWQPSRMGGLAVAVLCGVLLAGTACTGEPSGPAQYGVSAPDAYEQSIAGARVLIDIRRPEEWRETGVAATAIPISIESHPQGVEGFVRDLEWATGGDRSAPIAIICRTGNRTSRLAPQLRAMGFTDVTTVDEGMAGSAAGPGWLSRGLPLR